MVRKKAKAKKAMTRRIVGKKDSHDNLLSLSVIMGKVHALADCAWPRDPCGVSPMPQDAEWLIMDIQAAASKALGLPENLNLMCGDLTIDLDQPSAD